MSFAAIDAKRTQAEEEKSSWRAVCEGKEERPTPMDNDIDSHRHNRGSNSRLVNTAEGLLAWPPPPPPSAVRPSTDSVDGGVVSLISCFLSVICT